MYLIEWRRCVFTDIFECSFRSQCLHHGLYICMYMYMYIYIYIVFLDQGLPDLPGQISPIADGGATRVWAKVRDRSTNSYYY